MIGGARADEILETDVLIVGAEGAGARAAIEANRHGARVILLTKGSGIGKAGATVTAQVSNIAIDGWSIAELLGMPGDRDDTWESFFEDIVTEGRYVNDQRQAEVLAQEAGLRAKELTDWGFRWTGAVSPGPGHRHARSCYGRPNTGPSMLKVLGRVLKHDAGVWMVGDTLAVDLLTTDGRAVGLVGLDLQTGRLRVFKAKAIILATGGAQSVYPYFSGSHDLTGDGHAMAYRAGAELIDMQFVQLNPGALLWPPGWNHVGHGPVPYLWGRHFGGAHLLNRRGERFLAKWDPARMENTTGDVLGMAIATEVAEGRGSKHGGVYLSLKHLPDNLLDCYAEWGYCRDWKSHAGFDYRPLIEQMKRGLAIEVGIYCHFFMGGIGVDEWGRTSVPGLYAAGECTGIVNGANRLSGVALTQVLVQGARTGRAAAEYARTAGLERVQRDQIEAVEARVLRPLLRKDGVEPLALRRALQRVAYDRVGILRDKEGLESALREVQELQHSVTSLATKTKCREYNLEWVDAIQAMNSLQVLELMALSSLHRTESRGAHCRRDYPAADDDKWLKNVIVTRGDGQPTLQDRPALTTRLKPPVVG